MIGELGRNALIVLAEMADPANSRFDSEKGMRWAKHVIAHRHDLIAVLLDVMAVTRANDAVEAERARIAEENLGPNLAPRPRGEPNPSASASSSRKKTARMYPRIRGVVAGDPSTARRTGRTGSWASPRTRSRPTPNHRPTPPSPTSPSLRDVADLASDRARMDTMGIPSRPGPGGLPSPPPPPRVRHNPPCLRTPSARAPWRPALRRSSRAWGTTTTLTRRGASGRRSSATGDPAAGSAASRVRAATGRPTGAMTRTKPRITEADGRAAAQSRRGSSLRSRPTARTSPPPRFSGSSRGIRAWTSC